MQQNCTWDICWTLQLLCRCCLGVKGEAKDDLINAENGNTDFNSQDKRLQALQIIIILQTHVVDLMQMHIRNTFRILHVTSSF